MKYVIILSAALSLCALILFTGCTSPGSSAPATPAVITPAATTTLPTPVPSPSVSVATPAATTGSGDDGPVEVMPPAQQVNFDLAKDRPTSKLYLTYQGGAGDIFTRGVTMKVYASDGTVEEYSMSSGQKPIPNDQIIATGTKGGDRCVVYVLSGNATYKVIDRTVYAMG